MQIKKTLKNTLYFLCLIGGLIISGAFSFIETKYSVYVLISLAGILVLIALTIVFLDNC